MITGAFFVEHWFEIIFGLISAGLLAYFRNLDKKFQQYKEAFEKLNENKLDETIEEKLNPLQEQIDIENKKFEALKEDYGERLINLCREYLERGYLTSDEFSALTAMWKTYHEGLKGNGRGQDFYERVCELPSRDIENKNRGS